MAQNTRSAVDLDAYAARIGWEGERTATAETLRFLNRAHQYAISFENLAAARREAPSLALADVQAKLVHGRRGGYCFEQNALFAAVLEALGFGVTRYTARVRVGADGAVRPRSHMLLEVRVPGDSAPWLADVGFGYIGSLLEAIPLRTGAEVSAGGRRHRLVHEPHDGPLELWVLQSWVNGEWEDLYAFTREPFEPTDYEALNWFAATSPRSPFTQNIYVQRTTPEAHLALIGRVLTVTGADGGRRERKVADAEEMRRVLAEDFGIEAPADTVLPG